MYVASALTERGPTGGGSTKLSASDSGEPPASTAVVKAPSAAEGGTRTERRRNRAATKNPARVATPPIRPPRAPATNSFTRDYSPVAERPSSGAGAAEASN